MDGEAFTAFLAARGWSDAEAMRQLGIGSHHTLAVYKSKGGPAWLLLACEALTARAAPPRPHKASHVGAPAVFALELACQELNRAFAGNGAGHCYLVGSALDRADRRDIDIRLMLPDDEFDRLFPAAQKRYWEHDPRWIIMVVGISKWLSDLSGLPVDFQFQRQSNANERHRGRRDAMGMIFASGPPE